MELDIVGYRFSNDELGLLADIFGYEKIASLQVEVPDFLGRTEAEHSLEQTGNLINMGTTYNVDEITALLINAVCKADRYITVKSDNVCFVLYQCDQLVILAQKCANGYVLKPERSKEMLFDEIGELVSKSKDGFVEVWCSVSNETSKENADELICLFKTL